MTDAGEGAHTAGVVRQQTQWITIDIRPWIDHTMTAPREQR